GPGLADWPVRRKKLEFFRHFPRAANRQTANSELLERSLQRIDDGFKAVAIADTETHVHNEVGVGQAGHVELLFDLLQQSHCLLFPTTLETRGGARRPPLHHDRHDCFWRIRYYRLVDQAYPRSCS